MARTFLEVIEDLRELTTSLRTFQDSMRALSDDRRYTRQEREAVAEFGKFAQRLEERLKAVNADVGSLAVAHSNVPFDEILKAIGK